MKKTEIKEVLEKLNTTETEMDRMWAELYEDNFIIRNLTDNGKSWRDMNSIAAASLPTTYDKEMTLRMPLAEYLKSNDADGINVLLPANKQIDISLLSKIPEDTLLSNIHEAIDSLPQEEPPSLYEVAVQKLMSGEELNESEIKELKWESNVIEETNGENRRWTRSVDTIIEVDGRYFCIMWEQGLTECQPDEYWEQPYEVERITTTKTITVDEWYAVNRDV